MKKIALTYNQKRFAYSIVTSVLSLSVLLLSILGLKYSADDTGNISPDLNLWMFGTYLALSLSRLPLVFRAQFVEKKRLPFFRNIALASLYVLLAILYLVFPIQAAFYGPLAAVYFLVAGANRVAMAFEKKKPFNYVFNGLLALLFFVSAILTFCYADEITLLVFLFAQLTIIMMVGILETLAFAFSSIQLKGIIKIMRKTYAFEVLYGLVVLVLSCSLYFAVMEPSIPTFEDGLWYSFAVFTTIGFGDLTVSSTFSRILTVILGLYGIVVVAVLTSIIVNFYNETKDKEPSSEPEESGEKKEDEPKSE